MADQEKYLTHTKTERGFPRITFTDRYDAPCSITESSLASEDAIWLGIDDPSPKVMAIHAKQLNIETEKTVGWIEYPIPDMVLLTTRMHLTRTQVAELLPILQGFVDTGKVADPATNQLSNEACGLRNAALEEAYQAADNVLPFKNGEPRSPTDVRNNILNAILALK